MTFKFELMDAWKKSIAWANEILDFTETISQPYQFSLGDQLRRAALSVPTNLAEGSGRDNPRERKYFYAIAKGSVYEVVSLLFITKQRGLLSHQDYQKHYQDANEIAAMISGLINAAEREIIHSKQIREDTAEYSTL
jgi:four helix bundle protein